MKSGVFGSRPPTINAGSGSNIGKVRRRSFGCVGLLMALFVMVLIFSERQLQATNTSSIGGSSNNNNANKNNGRVSMHTSFNDGGHTVMMRMDSRHPSSDTSSSSTPTSFPALSRRVDHVDSDSSIAVRSHDGSRFLVVVGIPTTDTDFGFHRRQWQRRSWFTYAGVWPGNGQGTCSNARTEHCMLVKYLIGKHPSHDYEFSSALHDEAKEKGDIIPLQMREGKPTTGKKSGGAGYWGLESEVGMSRKALLWYKVAPLLFHSDYVMKCDDDVFIRVPQYVKDLHALHQIVSPTTKSLYWGKVMKWGAVKGDPSSTFYFVGGMSITMSTELAQFVSQYSPIQEHIGDFVDGDPKLYKDHNMDHEDVMIGRIFYTAKKNVTMVKDCRYHDVHTGANVKSITERSVAVHHLKEEEYVQLRKRFDESRVVDTVWHATSAKKYHTAMSPC